MERFRKRYEDRISGIISGFDRIIFRGVLRSISYPQGMDIWLSSRGVLYKNFRAYVLMLSDQIKKQGEETARSEGRPSIYLQSSRESKEKIAQGIALKDQIKEGLICLLSCVEPCFSYTVSSDRASKKLRLGYGQRKCLHLYFYYMDREFGLMHVRVQTWFPFMIQVYVNGQEWLSRAMNKEGIEYKKNDNCFTAIKNVERAQELSDRLGKRGWVRFLNALAKRVNPLIRDKKLSLRSYYWTIWECEYATDVMFKSAKDLRAVYKGLSRFAIEEFGSEDVLSFFGRRMDGRYKGWVESTFKRGSEGTRVKHQMDGNSLKMYDKADSVLRVETTINNPRRFMVSRVTERKDGKKLHWLRMRKGIADVGRRVELSLGINKRYLEALSVLGEIKPSHQVLDSVSQRIEKKGRAYRGLRPITAEESRMFGIFLRGEFKLQGIRNEDLRREFHSEQEQSPEERNKASARVSRYLRLLQAHRLIYKVQKTNYYRITKKGHEVMTTSLRFRESDIALLAA